MFLTYLPRIVFIAKEQKIKKVLSALLLDTLIQKCFKFSIHPKVTNLSFTINVVL
jgi:hypothetical protein